MVHTEDWKIIPNFDNYEINRDGVVRRKYKNGKIKNLTQYLRSGYPSVGLTKQGKTTPIVIHRALGLCFIPNPENKPQIDHINRDRADNRLENLRWATNKENNLNKDFKKETKIYETQENVGKHTYTYFRIQYWDTPTVKKQTKRFKTREEAESYLAQMR